MDSWKAREIRISKGDREMAGQTQVWMVNWAGPGPGERSTELVLAQDKGSVEKDKSQFWPGRCFEQTRNPEVFKGVYWGPMSNPPLLDKGRLE